MSVTLMLRPSPIMDRIAGRPSTVAGIFTYRFGAVDAVPELASLGLGAGGVAGETPDSTSTDT